MHVIFRSHGPFIITMLIGQIDMPTCTQMLPCPSEALLVGSQACAKFVARATEEMGAINIYEIYADVCRDWRADVDGRQLLRALAGPRRHAAPRCLGLALCICDGNQVLCRARPAAMR